MTNLKTIRLCLGVNFRKWLVNPRIYALAIFIIAFLIYHQSRLSQFAGAHQTGVTPWIFSHLTTTPVLQVFATFAIILFSDAPFEDKHMPFLMIRSGRRNWIIGQIIYILTASLIYTLFVFIVSILALLPNLEFSMEWGIVIQTLASGSQLPVNVTVFANPHLLTTFTPIEATLLSLGLFWLVSSFIGILISFFNIVVGKTTGLIAAGFVLFLSFFTIIEARLALGHWVSYLSPVSWMSLSALDWNDPNAWPSPPIAYAVSFLLIACIGMSGLAIHRYCKKDITFKVGGY